MGEIRVKSKASLKCQLADYSRGACAKLERPENATGIKSWVRYSAAAASALAAVASADAGVIYSGLQIPPIRIGPNLDAYGYRSIDINGDGLPDFKIIGYETNSTYGVGKILALTHAGVGILPIPGGTFNGDAIKFSASQNVGPGGLFERTARLATNTSGGKTAGQFQNGTTGFAGFRFNPGDGNHYGWIRLRLDDSNSNDLTDTVTVFDWAYESTIDTPIHIGIQTTAVPEPSSLTIVGLAMGCSALPGLRRRRQLQKAAASQANG